MNAPMRSDYSPIACGPLTEWKFALGSDCQLDMMPEQNHLVISKRTVDALSVHDRDAVFWDRRLPGFGVRVYPSGRKVYIVQSRGPHGSRRATLGGHGPLAADQARRAAAAAIDRIKQGKDPLPPQGAKLEAAPTVADLAGRFMREHARANCKPSTVETYRSTVDVHIVPALGGMSVDEVDRKHVADLHYSLRENPFAANAVRIILGKMFSLAEAWGLRAKGTNPCRFVRRYPEPQRERFLTREEFRRLGAVLEEAESDGSVHRSAVAAIRLLLLTGCRKMEILGLKWDDVDRTSGELRLRDGKSGARMVPLSPTVAELLDAMPRVTGNPWVIAGRKPGAPLCGLYVQWKKLRERAGLNDVRIHDLRHSYASRALAVGESLTMIGALLGHSEIASTARYAHLVRDTEKAAAAKVGGSIGADILPEDSGSPPGAAGGH